MSSSQNSNHLANYAQPAKLCDLEVQLAIERGERREADSDTSDVDICSHPTLQKT